MVKISHVFATSAEASDEHCLRQSLIRSSDKQSAIATGSHISHNGPVCAIKQHTVPSYVVGVMHFPGLSDDVAWRCTAFRSFKVGPFELP